MDSKHVSEPASDLRFRNHEFYGQQLPKLTAEIKAEARGTNVHVLENDSIEVGGIVFLGASLWTDFNLHGDVAGAQAEALARMADYQNIRSSSTYRRFRPADARRLFAESSQWLGEETARLAAQKVVVVTHHAPSPRSIPEEFRNNSLNPAFASNLESFIESSGPAIWIHGHIHQAGDYVIGSTRVIANPRGYPKEDFTRFQPDFVAHI